MVTVGRFSPVESDFLFAARRCTLTPEEAVKLLPCASPLMDRQRVLEFLLDAEGMMPREAERLAGLWQEVRDSMGGWTA